MRGDSGRGPRGAPRWLRPALVAVATAGMLSVPSLLPHPADPVPQDVTVVRVPDGDRTAASDRTRTSTPSPPARARAATTPAPDAAGPFRSPRTQYPVGLPRIVERLIPYPQRRKEQMARYAAAHYGVTTWRLTPQVVVLHFTESDSPSAVIAHFARNAANRGELPGVCAHFLVDTDGTVNELVPTSVMCRHTIGLNHTAIGIEVVQSTRGHSSAWADAQILARPAQMRSLQLLVAGLQDRYGIPTSNVVGHGTANSSPLFTDRKGWRNDHTDWGPAAVAQFRRRLPAPA